MIAAVNSFRRTFNARLETNYEMLDNTRYFFLSPAPYGLADVTDRVNPDGHGTAGAPPS